MKIIKILLDFPILLIMTFLNLYKHSTRFNGNVVKNLGVKALLMLLVMPLFGLHLPIKAAESIQAVALRDGKSLTLNGIGKVKLLFGSFYIGALYLEIPYRSVDDIVYMNTSKRMQLRIVRERISPRQFGQYWKESISINNPRNIWSPQIDNVLALTSLFKQPLIKGDIINLDYIPEMGTYVYLNTVFMGQISTPSFYNLLLMTWLGKRPPSKLFKLGVMGRNDTVTAAILQQEFELLNPVAKRIEETSSWLKDVASKSSDENTKQKPKLKTKISKKIITKPKQKTKPNLPKIVKKTNRKPEKQVQKKKAFAKEKSEAILLSKQLELVAQNLYIRKLRRAIRKQKKYPVKKMLKNKLYIKEMKKNKMESNVVVWVKIDRMGYVLEVLIDKSSGIDDIDIAALEALENAVPLPKIPEKITKDDFEFSIPLSFSSPDFEKLPYWIK